MSEAIERGYFGTLTPVEKLGNHIDFNLPYVLAKAIVLDCRALSAYLYTSFKEGLLTKDPDVGKGKISALQAKSQPLLSL